MPDQHLKILVASSHSDVLQRARAAMTANNWSVSVASEYNLASILAHVRASPPDILLLDTTDPTIDPLRLVQELAGDGPIPFPLILLTGGEAEAATPLAPGAYDIVNVETMAPELLRHVVPNAVERASLRRQLDASEGHFRQLAADVARHLAHLEAIYASAPVGLAFTDAEHRYTHANEQLAAYAGYSVEEMVGRSVATTLPPELAEQAVAVREQVMATGKAVMNVELVGPTRAGPESGRHWLGSYYPVYDGDGQPLGVNSVILDVTHQKQQQHKLEETVRARTAQVRQLATDLTLAEHRERRRIARILHDDIQQKLYALQVHIHLLRQETAGREEAGEGAGAASTAALIGRLIDELIEDNSSLSVELSPPVISHQGLIDSIGWLRQYIGDKHGLHIHVQTEGDVNVQDLDLREVIFQMVRELLLNVAYHAGVGEASLLLRRAGDRLVIRVEDRGSGFDPDAALADDASQPALGLRTLRERADLFGGTLHIVSRPGAGTRITLTMPAIIS